MKRLKEKWGITSNFQFIIILIVFSITGYLAVWVAKPVLELIGLDKSVVSPWIFWPIRIAIIFPIYQVMIVVIGALFGQFKFFWAFEKKMLVRLGFKHFKTNK
ncbi:MAG: diacylglyceryl transferase [Flavobacteriales bacterium]|nr:diacylglyceryl transferase [Flavobacteriales bacterium]